MTLVGLGRVEEFCRGAAVLSGLELKANERAGMGLVRSNDTGKSTLLKTLVGQAGEVTWRRGLKVSCLRRHIDLDARAPVDVIRFARPDLSSRKAEPGMPEVAVGLRRMQRLLESQEGLPRRFKDRGGPGFRGGAQSHLRTLGFGDAYLSRPTIELSGGRRELVVPAACTVQPPDVPPLDEPETRPGASRREQLGPVIRAFDGAAASVSHDRYFLDRMDDRIGAVCDGEVRFYEGGYSAWREKRGAGLASAVDLSKLRGRT